MIIASRKILTEEGFLDGYLEIQDGEIKRILAKDEYQGIIDLDASDAMVLPGLVDIHLHGYKGRLDPNIELDETELDLFLLEMAKQGTTSCLPSIDPQHYDAIRNYTPKENGSRFLGLNLEAYFSNLQYAGYRQPNKQLNLPSIEHLEELIRRSGNRLSYVMVAPELDGAMEGMEYLHKQGIKVSAGHTLMTANEFRKFTEKHLVDALTHTGNNMGVMHQRDVGVMGVGLLDPDIVCELITDFIHVSEEMVRLILRVKEHDKIILVSDSVSLAGQPAGEYSLKGHRRTVGEDCRILDEHGGIQGCYFTLYQNLCKLLEREILPFDETVKMASLYPARFLQCDDRLGSIKVDKKADLLIVDPSMKLLATFVGGKKIN